MTKTELRATFSLASILSIRMLGLFMILPVFALYAEKFKGATPFLIGFALGIYGLTQAIFQLPFGMLSDKIGRKSVVSLGLLIFIVGSVLAAISNHIALVILGRALQGAGAIGSTLIAFIADFTRSEHRTKAMAIMGMTIGISFIFAMIAGPFLNSWIGLAGIFWICAGLGLLGFVILYVIVPSSPHASFHRDAEPVPSQFFSALFHQKLLPLNISIGCLHLILTASFVAIPILLSQTLGLKEMQQWRLYLGVMIFSFIVMMPMIVIAEKKHKTKVIILFTIALLGFAELLIWKFKTSISGISLGLLIFFIAFNFLEASLPSLVSKVAPSNNRGTAMGIYSTCQFLGIFIGGSLGGWLLQHGGLFVVMLVCSLVAFVWWVYIATTTLFFMRGQW